MTHHALILCAQLGWFEGATQLLARRANPNIANRSGETPLIVASSAAISRWCACYSARRQSEPDRQSLRQFGDRLCPAGSARRGDPARAQQHH